jgi:cytosine/creatinine deaminase
MTSGFVDTDRDRRFLQFAVELARGALARGEIPIAAVIADVDSLISTGVNQRVATGRLVSHAETTALDNAGRGALPRLRQATMYCTLSPCAMCSGAIILYRIPRVVVADRRTFEGPTHKLQAQGCTVSFMDDPVAYQLLSEFRTAQPDLWAEDNGGR